MSDHVGATPAPPTDHDPVGERALPTETPAAETGPPQPAPPIKQTERPHPLTPFIRGWIVLLAILVGVGRELVPDGSPDDSPASWPLGWILLALLGAVLLAGVAGAVTWYFTRFVIDDDELRIETGAIFKNSKKVPFERLQSIDIIQPLAARMFGLAELRLEVGTGDSTIKLRYLTRAQASHLRDYLLTRAHGEQASLSPTATGVPTSVFTDLSTADKPLVTVTPQRLVASFLLSLDWLVALAAIVALLVLTLALGTIGFALTGLIPLVIGAMSMISKRVIGMFNFTLAQSTRGVRITRGLFNLTSQSIPVNRIQGIRVSQSVLWRSFGWYRIDVNVLGYGTGDGEDNESTATSVLLPVADRAQVDLAMSRILPGLDLAQVELHPSPIRARWIRPFDFWTLRYGYDDRVVVTEHGWLTRNRNIIPHAKVQSVRLYQGPWQRSVRVADVHFDITRGPVVPIAHQIDESAARLLALTELDRARAARAADREHLPLDRVPLAEDRQGEDEVLRHFGVQPEDQLGSGGESIAFPLGEDRVLRLYRRSHEAPERTIGQLRALYDAWAGADIGVQVPRILDAGQLAGRWFSVDRRMSGGHLSGWLARAETEPRREVLLSYLDAAIALRRLPSPTPGFARLVGDDAPRQFETLAELLSDQLLRVLAGSHQRLDRDIPQVVKIWDALQEELAARTVEPAVVHGDYCPPNVYLGRGLDGGHRVTGVGDFSPHTLNADPMMDVAGAVIFLELEPYQAAGEDALWLGGQAVERLGPDTATAIELYRKYYGFYFSAAHEFDPALYGWCVRQLDR